MISHKNLPSSSFLYFILRDMMKKKKKDQNSKKNHPKGVFYEIFQYFKFKEFSIIFNFF